MRIVLIFSFLLTFGAANSQTPTMSQLNATVAIGGVSTGGTGDYTISAFFNDLTGDYQVTDIQVGDIIWDAKCDVYEITAINQVNPFLQVEVTDINGMAPATAKGVVFRSTTNYDYPLVTTGLPAKMLSCIQNHRAIEIDEDIGNSGGFTVYGEYKNDADAAANGVPIDGYYVAILGNTMGSSKGLVKRKY